MTWLSILLLSGCIFRTSDIVYPLIRQMDGLVIIKKGNRFESCLFENGNVPTVYKLSKDNFTLYIILGNRHFPKLFLGAIDKSGKILNILTDESYNKYFHSIKDIRKIYRMPFEDKELNLYSITKVYNITRTLDIKKEISNPFRQISLYLHDKNEKKIGNIKLKLELKLFDCVSIEGI